MSERSTGALDVPDSDRSRIGILEDEPGMRRLLQRVLTPEFSVFFAQSGADLNDAVRNECIDLVLLDILLPGEDGIAIATSVRARSQIPIILLSGLSSSETILTGLNVGADDYVTKPFQSEILLARLRNSLRRAPFHTRRTGNQSRLLEICDCQVDVWARTVSHRKNKMVVKLTEKEIQILSALARDRGEPVNRDVLSRLLSGQNWSPTNRCLDVHMSHLRKKLYRVCEDQNIIICYRGVGYALKAALAIP